MEKIIKLHMCPGGRITQEQNDMLQNAAYQIRVNTLHMISRCNWGHPGGSLSMADCLAVLYGGAANVSPETVEDPKRDYIVFSKAHASPSLYSALYHYGYLNEEQFFSYGQIGGIEGHLAKGEPKGVECNGGSLGLGLSYAVGLANALKLSESFSQRVFCICGDGELNEGQMWEAMMSAAQYKLDNLIMIVDYNKVMAKSFVYNGMGLEPLTDKIKAFGFDVAVCDGHDISALVKSVYDAKYISITGKPKCIIMHTVKGRGVDECEFNYYWHTHAPDMNTANRFLRSLADNYGKEYVPIESVVKGKDGGLEKIIRGGL